MIQEQRSTWSLQYRSETKEFYPDTRRHHASFSSVFHALWDTDIVATDLAVMVVVRLGLETENDYMFPRLLRRALCLLNTQRCFSASATEERDNLRVSAKSVVDVLSFLFLSTANNVSLRLVLHDLPSRRIAQDRESSDIANGCAVYSKLYDSQNDLHHTNGNVTSRWRVGPVTQSTACIRMSSRVLVEFGSHKTSRIRQRG